MSHNDNSEQPDGTAVIDPNSVDPTGTAAGDPGSDPAGAGGATPGDDPEKAGAPGGDNAGGDKPDKPEKPAKNGKAAKKTDDDTEPDIPVGTIRVRDGKEIVKVAADDWRPVIRAEELPEDDTVVKVKNEALKSQKIFSAKGKEIFFNDNGVAEVSSREAERLITIPGFAKV